MHIHLFYRIYENFSQDKLPLYAYTANDDYAKEFMKQRNMKVFRYVKEKVTEEEKRTLDQKYAMKQLSRGSFFTRNENTFSIHKLRKVEVLCTWEEEESVIRNSERFWDENKRVLMDCNILKDKYLKALKKILYIDFYIFYVQRELRLNNSFYDPYIYTNYGPSKNFIDEIDNTGFGNKFEYDDLQLFLHFFQDTFQKKKKDSSD